MSEIRKKKVLFCITKSNFGGAQRYVYDLATALPRERFDIAVAFGEGGELEEKLHGAGVRTIRINALQRNVSVLKDFSVFFELVRIFKKERPDAVHLNSTKVGGVGGLAARICGISKIIFTAHGWAFNEKRNAVSRAMIAFLQWMTVIFSHVTIAVSQKTADQILAFPFVGENKIKVIYNGVADVDFLPREEARRVLISEMATEGQAAALTQNQTIWIGTISELHSNKGVDIALTAFSKIAEKYPQAIYFVIGEGEERTRLSFQITKLGLSNQVFLAGFIPNAKKYLKAFDIFTLTSRTEALPYSILEAGLAELPVVANAVGGIPEIINSPETGTLIPVESDEGKTSQIITEALEKFIVNPEHAKILGQNLNRRVISNFSQEKMLSETFALYPTPTISDVPGVNPTTFR